MTYNIINIDLSIPRINEVYNLSGDSIKVLNVTSDCFIQFDDTTQDPINLLLVDEIKIKYTKFYLSNVGIKNQFIKIIVSENFSFYDKIGIPEYINVPITEPIPAFRIPITIPHTKVTWNIDDNPIYIKLRQNNFDFTKTRNDGFDVYFTKDDGVTLLDFERDRHDKVNLKGDYIVKIPHISKSTDTKFYMYYGNPDANDVSNPVVTWYPIFESRWTLKENPTNPAPQIKDSTINANHGTIHGGMTSTNSIEGKINKALIFDGIDDYIEIPHTITLNRYHFTVEALVKVTGGQGTWRSVITSRDSPLERGYIIYAGNNNTWQFWGGEFHNWDIVHGPPIELNQWTYLAVSYNGVSAIFYVNGTMVGGRTMNFVINCVHPLRIGAGTTETTPNHFFNGIIDEVRYSHIGHSRNWVKLQHLSLNDTLLIFGPEEKL